MFLVLKNRGEVVSKTSELILQSKQEIMLMGRHIAWIETEPTFADAIKAARDKGVTIRVLSVKEQTPKKFSQGFERLGCYVRFYNHGDIRVLMFDRTQALIALPSQSTRGSPFFTRDYVAIYTDDELVLRQLAQRFEDMWEKGRKEAEATIRERAKYFLTELRGELIAAVVVGVIVFLLAYFLRVPLAV